MQETYNPSRAAKQIGIPNSTLRLWAKTYAEFLSPGANPPAGEERRLTVADVETLKAVNQMRHNGMLPPDIAQRLRINAAAGQQDAPQSIVAAVDVPTQAETSHDSIQRFLQASDVRDKLTDIDRRLERVEGQRTLVLVAVVAFVAGVVLVVAVVWIMSFMR
jgi:DNA-binding transcriptional MerR regulator